MSESEQRLLTLAEVARFLGVERRVISNYIRDRGLPVIRISRNTVRVDPRQLDKWIAEHSEQGKSEP